MPANAVDVGLIPGLERSPGEGNGYPHQCSCLENPMDRATWWATVHGVAKNQSRLSNWACLHTHSQKNYFLIILANWVIIHTATPKQTPKNWQNVYRTDNGFRRICKREPVKTEKSHVIQQYHYWAPTRQNGNSKQYMHPSVLYNTTYNTQDMERTQVSINRGIDTEDAG